MYDRSYVYDTETDLYYLQSRYYDPEMGRFISADTYASTGQGVLGNNMFAYCNNNPVMASDPTGKFLVDWDLLPNQQAGKEFTEWYTNTDKNEKDVNGNLSLDAKLKRTYQAINYDIELDLGLGVGIGKIQEVLDAGVGYACYFDILSFQYCDGVWDVGQRFVMNFYASALQPVEVGAGVDATFNNLRSPHGDAWIGPNPTQDSVTILSSADYSIFIGGNICIGFDVANFIKTMNDTWG